MRSRVLAFLGGLLLLLPATALAQSAGDKQYSDPFSGKVPTGAHPDNPAPSSSPPQPQSQPLASTGQTASSGSSAQQSAGSSSGSLPRTGSRIWILAVMGGLMMLGGTLLRLGVRPLTRQVAGPSPPILGRDLRLTRRR